MITPDTPLSLLQSLVSIPSVNPEGASDSELTTGHFGELEIANALVPFLESIGYEVSLEEVAPGRPNVIARAPGDANRPRVLLGPHLDTVGVETMTIEPFAAKINDGKLWGRGASDTKGPMASMLWGLKQNAHLLAEAPVAVDFVGFMGEETQQLGSKHFAQHHGSEYEFAIAGEPTDLEIVHCTKGCLWAQLSAKGFAVHASQPERGENAILKLQDIFSALRNALDSQFSKHTHPILGRTTWNLGVFKGGTRPNVVADYAELDLDIRTIPALWEQGGAKQLLERLTQDLEVELSYREENPPMEVSPDHKWIQAIQSAHPSSKCVGAPWFSDAAHLNDGGLPAICLGPGRIEQAHTEDEFISVADFESGCDYFTKLVASFVAR